MPVVVSFVGQNGGIGKSTLARALAAVAARGNLRVRLADLDAQQQTSVRWANTRDANRIPCPIDAEAFHTIEDALRRSPGFDLIGARTTSPTVLLFYELERMGIPKDQLAIALCRILELREEHGARKYVEAAGYEALQGSIPERIGYRRAQNRGQSLTETSDPAH